MDVEKVFGFTTGRSISLPLPPNSVLPLVSRLPFYADGVMVQQKPGLEGMGGEFHTPLLAFCLLTGWADWKRSP